MAPAPAGLVQYSTPERFSTTPIANWVDNPEDPTGLKAAMAMGAAELPATAPPPVDFTTGNWASPNYPGVLATGPPPGANVTSTLRSITSGAGPYVYDDSGRPTGTAFTSTPPPAVAFAGVATAAYGQVANDYPFNPSIPDDGIDPATGAPRAWVADHQGDYWRFKMAQGGLVGQGRGYNAAAETPAWGTEPGAVGYPAAGVPPADLAGGAGVSPAADLAEARSETLIRGAFSREYNAGRRERFVPGTTPTADFYRRPDGTPTMRVLPDPWPALPTGQYPNELARTGAPAAVGMLAANNACPVGGGLRPPPTPSPAGGATAMTGTRGSTAMAEAMAARPAVRARPAGGMQYYQKMADALRSAPMPGDPTPAYNTQDPYETTWGRENRHYGVTAEYARSAPSRYRYMRTPPVMLGLDTQDLTADAANAAMARRRQRDVLAIDRHLNNPAHNMGYVIEEMDSVEKFTAGWWGNAEYPVTAQQ